MGEFERVFFVETWGRWKVIVENWVGERRVELRVCGGDSGVSVLQEFEV